jgi:hypothetical protein
MSSPSKKNRLWIWFFVFVVVASIALAGFMIWFNLRLQLTSEKLEEARALWREHGPKDYLLTVTKKFGKEGSADTFKIKVRAGRVMEVRMNGELLRNHVTDEVFPPGDDRLQYYSMDRMFVDIERFLEKDAKEGQKNYNVALFDERTGAIRRYVRSERASRMHVEEEAMVEPLAP